MSQSRRQLFRDCLRGTRLQSIRPLLSGQSTCIRMVSIYLYGGLDERKQRVCWHTQVHFFCHTGRCFMPLTSDVVILKNPAKAGEWDHLTMPDIYADYAYDYHYDDDNQDLGYNENLYLEDGPFAPRPDVVAAAQGAAISGAASKIIDMFFCNNTDTKLWCNRWRNTTSGIKFETFKRSDGTPSKYRPIDLICEDYGKDPIDPDSCPQGNEQQIVYKAAFAQGATIAQLVSGLWLWPSPCSSPAPSPCSTFVVFL